MTKLLLLLASMAVIIGGLDLLKGDVPHAWGCAISALAVIIMAVEYKLPKQFLSVGFQLLLSMLAALVVFLCGIHYLVAMYNG